MQGKYKVYVNRNEDGTIDPIVYHFAEECLTTGHKDNKDTVTFSFRLKKEANFFFNILNAEYSK